MPALLSALLSSLVGPALLSGAPMPWVATEPWTPIPLGAPLRVAGEANCMGHIPPGLGQRLQVRRGGAPVAGRWVREERLRRTTGTQARFRFLPAAPLTQGTYQILGLAPPRGLSAHRRQPATVQVLATSDRTPPTFAGLTGLRCVPVNPLLGCRPAGIFFRSGPPQDASSTRLVLYLRRRGQRYPPDQPWETDGLSFGAAPLGGRLPPGRYVVTLRARDAADNEGGRICEAELRLPLNSCASFPRGRAAPKVRCARALGPGRWRSAVDGVTLRFPR